jgi:hypothetical protein
MPALWPPSPVGAACGKHGAGPRPACNSLFPPHLAADLVVNDERRRAGEGQLAEGPHVDAHAERPHVHLGGEGCGRRSSRGSQREGGRRGTRPSKAGAARAPAHLKARLVAAGEALRAAERRRAEPRATAAARAAAAAGAAAATRPAPAAARGDRAPKVRDLDAARVRVQQEVGGFQVAVYHAVGMKVVEALAGGRGGACARGQGACRVRAAAGWLGQGQRGTRRGPHACASAPARPGLL